MIRWDIIIILIIGIIANWKYLGNPLTWIIMMIAILIYYMISS